MCHSFGLAIEGERLEGLCCVMVVYIYIYHVGTRVCVYRSIVVFVL